MPSSIRCEFRWHLLEIALEPVDELVQQADQAAEIWRSRVEGASAWGPLSVGEPCASLRDLYHQSFLEQTTDSQRELLEMWSVRNDLDAMLQVVLSVPRTVGGGCTSEPE